MSTANTNFPSRVRLAVIGQSGRGRGLTKILVAMEDVEIVALCDLHDDRVQAGIELCEKDGRTRPASYNDYKLVLQREDLDAVVIATSWTSHAPIAIAAMKAGLYTATEVGPASSLQECWDLVRTSEETGMPYMMLENCCYGRDEMAILNMVKKGLFGELIHCQCGYQHDLRDEVALGVENRHYRIHNYLHRNGDVYPTHGVGPIAKHLGINRGNRFVTLSSMASKARGINEWASHHLGPDHRAANANFALGDIVTTMIQCQNGETVMIVHDTSLPRPYSRAGRVQGTKGIWMEDNQSIYFDGKSPAHSWEPFGPYRTEHEHPLWKEYIEAGVRGGHGGMDYLVLRAFVESVAKKIAPPIDVYDAVTWRVISVLSEQSIALGGSAVAFPDFTNGRWFEREPSAPSRYSLDEINLSLYDSSSSS